MGIDLLKELKEKKGKKPNTRVAILAHLDQIKEALEAGYTVKDVWRVMTEKEVVEVSYVQFAQHVKKLAKTPKEQERVEPPKKVGEVTRPKSFSFDPKPDQDELV